MIKWFVGIVVGAIIAKATIVDDALSQFACVFFSVQKDLLSTR